MIKFYKTDDGIIREIEEIEAGCWIKMDKPTYEETCNIANKMNIDLGDIRAALDDEESARISLEDDYTIIIVDIASAEIRNNTEAYTTIPLGIILKDSCIITVCSQETPVLNYFTDGVVRDFSTKKRMRFVYQILYRTSVNYQLCLRVINRKRSQIEERIHEETEDIDLINLHELESNLVYFVTSLRGNGAVLERLTRYERIQQYPEDKELLEDVIIENKQAIEMTQVYRDIIHGTRELLSTVINNRLNNVMKVLTSVTIVMAIPTVISGLYGMNVNSEGMPFANLVGGFGIVCLMITVICLIAAIVLRKRNML